MKPRQPPWRRMLLAGLAASCAEARSAGPGDDPLEPPHRDACCLLAWRPAVLKPAVLVRGTTPWNPRTAAASEARATAGANSGPAADPAAGTDEGERPRPVSTTTTKNPSRFGFASHLACRECGATSDLGASHVCAQCFGPLEVRYDLPALTRSGIESGPRSIWRYASLLPVPPDVAASPNTEPGCTRLVRADQLARELGMAALWVKDERGNPTHSFKDRVVAVALAAAVELGYKVLACPSTGNLANAVAAAAAASAHRQVNPAGPHVRIEHASEPAVIQPALRAEPPSARADRPRRELSPQVRAVDTARPGVLAKRFDRLRVLADRRLQVARRA